MIYLATARELFNSVNNTLDEIEKDESIWQETPEGKKACEKRLEELRAAWNAFIERADMFLWIGRALGGIFAVILSMWPMISISFGHGWVLVVLYFAILAALRRERAESAFAMIVMATTTVLALFEVVTLGALDTTWEALRTYNMNVIVRLWRGVAASVTVCTYAWGAMLRYDREAKDALAKARWLEKGLLSQLKKLSDQEEAAAKASRQESGEEPETTEVQETGQ